MIERNENGIFYLYKYYPYTTYHNMQFYRETKSIDIMNLKNNQEDAVNNFAIDIYAAIKEILSNYGIIGKNVGLVAVPPSKVNKTSPVRNIIEKIIVEYGVTKDYRINTLFECKYALERIVDVNTAHEGNRNSYSDHIRSIKCNADLLDGLNKIILIDDVTTAGVTMNACTDILVNNGFNINNIYRLAIGKTV